MKKLLSLVLLAAILIGAFVCGTVPASAVDNVLTVKVGDKTYTAKVGDTITYTAKLKSDKKIAAGQFELPVDFTLLSGDSEADLNNDLANVMPVVFATGAVHRFDTASKNGLIGYVFNFAADTGYDFTAEKVAFTIKLKVLKAGTANLNLVLREFVDEGLNDLIDIDGKAVSGNVTANIVVDVPASGQKILMGDLNGNGKVNNADYQLIARYVLGWAGYKEKIKVFAAADLNGNGKVNNADYQILARYVLGWKGYDKYIVEKEV